MCQLNMTFYRNSLSYFKLNNISFIYLDISYIGKALCNDTDRGK